MVSVWPTWIIHLWEKLCVGISLAVAASSKPHNFPGAFSPQLEISALTKSTVNWHFKHITYLVSLLTTGNVI